FGSTDSRREFLRRGCDAAQLGERTPDGQRELRARTESLVVWQRALDVHVHAGVQIVMTLKPLREFRGALRILAVDTQFVCGPRHSPRGGAGAAGADPADPTTERAAQIEHAEMQARSGLDDDHAHACSTAGCADRMKSTSSDIASSSRGPAVLFT